MAGGSGSWETQVRVHRGINSHINIRILQTGAFPNSPFYRGPYTPIIGSLSLCGLLGPEYGL